MDDPKTRSEKKKNQKHKGRQDRLGSSKHVRAMEALREKKSGTVTVPTTNDKQK